MCVLTNVGFRLSLQAEVKWLGGNISVEDKLKLIDKRKRLQNHINSFISCGETLQEADEEDFTDEIIHPQINNWDDEDVETSSDDEDERDPESSAVVPVMQALPLSSARTITADCSPLL